MTAELPTPPAHDARRASVRRVRLPVGTAPALALAYGAVYLAFLLRGWPSARIEEVVTAVAFMPLNLAAGLLLARGAMRRRLDRRVRRSLGLMAAGTLATLFGNVVSAWYALTSDVDPATTWANFFYLAFFPAVITAFLIFPVAHRKAVEWWKFALDAAVVLVGGGLASWYLVLLPAWDALSATHIVRESAFIVGNLLLLLAITRVLLRRPTGRNAIAFGLVVAGQLLSIVADMAYTLVYPVVGWKGGAWTDALYLAFYALLIAGAERYARRPQAGLDVPAGFTRVQPVKVLPYVAIAVGYLVLVMATIEHWAQPVGPLVIGAVALTMLVVARQVLSVRQNAHLLRQAAAAESEARFRALVQHSSDAILIVEPGGTVRYVSPSVRHVLGYMPADLVGSDALRLVHPDDVPLVKTYIRDATRSEGAMPAGAWRLRRPDGSWMHAETVATNLLDEPTVRALVLNTRDVSERKSLEDQLIHQAFHDPLTALANRALFRDRVTHAVSVAARQRRSLCVLFLDLDDFKKVNDSLGHAEGDRLLGLAAERLRLCARESDTVARLGGDEFAILLEDTSEEAGAALAGRIADAFHQAFRLGDREVFVTTSIGVAGFNAGESAEELLRNADVAMYSAKARGKGRHAAFHPQMGAAQPERLELEADLRQAASRGELRLHFQPIAHIGSGAIWGAEALVRWQHPRRGLLMPGEFIALAEENGAIVSIGRWVLREACRQAAAWNARVRRDEPVHVCVNISARQLQDGGLLEDVRAALADSGLPPAALILEITESVLMQHAGVSVENLAAFRAQGVRLALDDFGTGYSSLSYLQLFPIDILKIAKPFVDDIVRRGGDSPLARAIVALSSALHLHTIAEGIETPVQVTALAAIGCELGQGNHLAPAAEPERFASRVTAGETIGGARIAWGITGAVRAIAGS